MVKRWGKSPPRTWQQGRHGKPHPEQCRIGASRGKVRTHRRKPAGDLRRDTSARDGPGWQLDRRGNASGRGMVIQRAGSRDPGLGQNPAYRPSAHSACFLFPANIPGESPGPAGRWGLAPRARQAADPPRRRWKGLRRKARNLVQETAVSLLTLPVPKVKGSLKGFRGGTHVSPMQEKRLWRSRRRSRSV